MNKNYERNYFAEAHQILKGQGYRSYIQRLLPGGQWQGAEWVVKNPTRKGNLILIKTKKKLRKIRVVITEGHYGKRST